jgi:hypothetical protein
MVHTRLGSTRPMSGPNEAALAGWAPTISARWKGFVQQWSQAPVS